MKIEVSVGELLDKYSILEIKRELLKAEDAIEVVKELSYLKRQVEKSIKKSGISDLYNSLKNVNKKIWFDMETIFELSEKKGPRYFEAVESSILLNMERAYLKREINSSSNSKIFEVKSYFAKI